MARLNRRMFLGTVAAAGVAGSRTARADRDGGTLRIGVIGCGWYGRVVGKAALEAGGAEIAAVCDVDSDHLARAAGEFEEIQGGRPQGFKDYREMVAVPGLDIAVIATPPQWHALPFIAACEKGLDIYCEKPMSYDVREGRAMVEAARRTERIVQIGFQRRQSDAIAAAADYLRKGNAGRIVQVDIQIHYTAGRQDRTPKDPPASLDWDFWCGPAPKLPYSEAVGHFHWRLEKAYGNGHLVDWGIHLIDGMRHVLRESTPRSVQAAGGLYELRNHITTPDTLTVHYEFETCPVVWRHRIWGAAEYRPEVNNGIFFFGEKETVFATDTHWIIIPRGNDAEPKTMKVDTGPMQRRHVAEFLDCVRERRQPSVTPEDGHRSTTTVLLGMIAYETGRKITWDADRERIVGDPEANAMLRRDYRAPWAHPDEGT